MCPFTLAGLVPLLDGTSVAASRAQKNQARSNDAHPLEVTMAIVKYPFRSPSYSPWRDFDEVSNRLARLFEDVSVRRANGGIWS